MGARVERPMMPLRLQAVLKRLGVSYQTLAEVAKQPVDAIRLIVERGIWPMDAGLPLRQSITAYVREAGASRFELQTMFWPVPGKKKRPNGAATPSGRPVESHITRELAMLMRKQGLSPAAKRHFGLFFNPFDGEVQSPDEMFLSPEIRHVRESVMAVAKSAGCLVVTGESGSGKSTLIREWKERIERERVPIVVIEPAIVAMEENDMRGKMLKASSIYDSILWTLAPKATPRSTIEGKERQISELLADSARTGTKHVLLIEEAHALPTPTLRHLKRFNEIRLGKGMQPKLLAVILVGQPELLKKLAQTNPEVREVTQRFEVVQLAPLDSDLEGYLKKRLELAGKKLDEIIDATGIAEVRQALTVERPPRRLTRPVDDDRDMGPLSMLYPLVVNNVMTACLNRAAALGVPKVTADVVREIRPGA